MSSKGYLAIWAGCAFLALGMLGGCDTGQQQEPGSPATGDESGDDLAMYDPDDRAGDQTGGTRDPYAEQQQPSTSEPSTAEDPMMGAERSQQPGMGGAGASLESMSADQLVGKPIVSQEGEEIGDIQEIVTDPTSNQKFAVVDVGGFLGVGQKSVVIGLDELRMASGQDRIESDLTRQEVQTMTEYSPGDYEPVTGGETGPDTTQ
ncbi:MAG TPA: PRC-barrel domain-containing protein [Woeseiaceae bacterium]|nr:PRC-barrel domain-containing protein [Woeseiaceae bacterium]